LSRLFRAALAALSLAAILGLPAPARATDSPKIAIIVGPVGSLTPTYLALAERAAQTAERHGATVARAYSPSATTANVLAAVADAKVVIYFGHGYGHPSPYGGLNTSKQNGWALQGPGARGTHGDAGSQVAYYGEDWIVANARPAPGFVMIYSNTCYAPGASEGGHAPATPWQAAQRVANYSRGTFAMGGSAYFATDFDHGAADLVERLLGASAATFGTAFVTDHRYVPSALTIQAHPSSAGQQIWLHRSKYTDGPPNYWYAFAGNPDLSPRRAWDRVAPTARWATSMDGATMAAPTGVITLQVSETVSGVSPDTVSLRDSAGGAVKAAVSWDAKARAVEIRPEAPLALSSRYDVVIADGIRDLAGRSLEESSLTLLTRVDADPLTDPLSIVLESGAHELARFGADGSVAETRPLAVRERLWLTADRRARPIGQVGSWLRIADRSLAGWWLVESGRAHALGQVEEAILLPDSTVALPAGQRVLPRLSEDGPQANAVAPAGLGEVIVDRRRVVDGRTYVHVADPRFAASWIEIDPVLVPTEARAQRILDVERREASVTVVTEGGAQPLFRFDASGRVVDRRRSTAHETSFASTDTLLVAGRRFLVIANGDLAGWAIAEGADVRLLTGAPAPPSSD